MILPHIVCIVLALCRGCSACWLSVISYRVRLLPEHFVAVDVEHGKCVESVGSTILKLILDDTAAYSVHSVGFM